MKKVLVLMAPGFEEVEAITVVDILRRGSIDVTIAGTIEGYIEGRTHIKVLPDIIIDKVNANEYDMLVLPGGPGGTDNLKADHRVRKIIDTMHSKNSYTAAICAAPTILSAIGMLVNKKVTSYPSFKNDINAKEYSEDSVVVDGNLITSRSPGTAMEFSLKLLELLIGKEPMEEVKKAVLA